MGLSYLLNLDEDYLDNIVETFKNLPQTELYFQILAYYCSIKLYSKMNCEYNKVFSYDPIELIKQMSSIQFINNDKDRKKLKQQINFVLMQRKQEEIHKDDRDICNKKNIEMIQPVVQQSSDFVNKLEIKDNSKNSNELKPTEKLNLDYNPPPEETDEWDNWGDAWTDIPNSSNENVNQDAYYTLLSQDNLSSEKRYELFKEEFSKIENVDDYRTVKQMLVQWPIINDLSSEDDIDSNASLQMIIKITNMNENCDFFFKEVKDFLNIDLIPKEVSAML